MTELFARLIPQSFTQEQITDRHPFAQSMMETKESRPAISVFQPQSLNGWTGNQYGVMDRLEESGRISKLLPFLASLPFFTPNNEGFVELWEDQPTEDPFTQPASAERILDQELTRTIIEIVSEKEPVSTTEKLGLPIVNSEIANLESIKVNSPRLNTTKQIENNQLLETLAHSSAENNLVTNQTIISPESDLILTTEFNTDNNELVNSELNSNSSIYQKSDDSEISTVSQNFSSDLLTTPQDNFNISIENQSNVSELIDWSQPLEDAVPLQVSKSGQLNLSSTNPTLINPNPQISKNSVAPQPANSIESPITVNLEDFSSTDDRPLATSEISALLNSSTSLDKFSVSEENNHPNNNQEPSTAIESEISADVAQLSQSMGNQQEILEIKLVTPLVHPLEDLSSIQSPEESNIENPISSQQSLTVVNHLSQKAINESTVLNERMIQTSVALEQSHPSIAKNKDKSLEIAQPNPVMSKEPFSNTVTPSVSKNENISVDSSFFVLEESSLSRVSVIEPKLLQENKSKISVTPIDIEHLTPIEPKEKQEVNLLIQQEVTKKEQNTSVSQNSDPENSASEEPRRSPSSPSESLINQIFPIKTFTKAITDLIQPLSHLSKDLINTQLELQSTENIVAKKNDPIPSQQSALDELSASNENDRREPSKSTSIRAEIAADVAQLSQSIANHQETLEIKPVTPLVHPLEALSLIQSSEESNIENPISSQQSLTIAIPLTRNVIDESAALIEKTIQTSIASNPSQPSITTSNEKSLEIVQPDPVVTNNSFYSTVTPSVSNDKKTSVDSNPSVPKESMVAKESKPKALSEFSIVSPEKSSLSRGSVIEPKLLQESKSKVSVTPIDIQHLTAIEPKEKQEVNLIIQQEITIKEQNTSVGQNSESSAPEEPRRSPSNVSQSLIDQIFPIRTFSKTIADPIKPLSHFPEDSTNTKSETQLVENTENIFAANIDPIPSQQSVKSVKNLISSKPLPIKQKDYSNEEQNLILENSVAPRQVDQPFAIASPPPINPIMPVISIQREVMPCSETSQRIVVTIGHIDVKISHSTPPNKPKPTSSPPVPSGPRLSLAEYLRRQNHPERGRS